MASYHLKKMGKKDFIAKLSEVSGKSKKQAAIDAQEFIKALKLSLYEAEDIQFEKFGRFTIERVAPHMVRDPRSGELILSQVKYRVNFKPSLDLSVGVKEAWEPVFLDIPEL